MEIPPHQQPNTLQMGILNRLPPEIRQSVYEHHYRDPRERIVYFTHNGRHGKYVVRVNAKAAEPRQPAFDLVRPDRTLLNLAVTCRQIYRESLPILYSSTAFRFLSGDALLALAFNLPPEYLGYLTTVTLEAPGYSLLEDYFDKLQWGRVWRIISSLRRLTHLTVNILDSERSLARHDWRAVLDPMMAVTGPINFQVMLHCEPDFLPVFEAEAPFKLFWLDEEGIWHQVVGENELA